MRHGEVLNGAGQIDCMCTGTGSLSQAVDPFVQVLQERGLTVVVH
jgi:hypothetical protein